MKTTNELKQILASHRFDRINSHVHTHLCDGKAEMTVENIAAEAQKHGLTLVILVPHFHKQVSDGITTLYQDSDEEIFSALREEIDAYEKRNGSVQFLLSTEADILSEDGEISLTPSYAAEKALDMISPTLNYHPALPLSAVCVTHIKEMDEIHRSGEFQKMADAAGGRKAVIESAFNAEINAVRRLACPVMLGHFLIKHTRPAGGYTWFHEQEQDLPMMEEKTRTLLEICAQKGAALDLTGMHLRGGRTTGEQQQTDGFLYPYQCGVITQCLQAGIPFAAGSDAHSLRGMASHGFYNELFGHLWK